MVLINSYLCAYASSIYQICRSTSVIFWIGIVSSAFSTGCFYGPVFSAIQEVVPANIRGSVVAFNLLCINLVGYSLGSYTAGLSIDYLLDMGVSQPYTHVLVASVVIYLLTGPICYYLAGKHYDADKKALEIQFSKETKGLKHFLKKVINFCYSINIHINRVTSCLITSTWPGMPCPIKRKIQHLFLYHNLNKKFLYQCYHHLERDHQLS